MTPSYNKGVSEGKSRRSRFKVRVKVDPRNKGSNYLWGDPSLRQIYLFNGTRNSSTFLPYFVLRLLPRTQVWDTGGKDLMNGFLNDIERED